MPGDAQIQDAWVAREWTAPTSGTIVIHGRVFTDGTVHGGGGDGVNVLIEKNGVAQWPADPTYDHYQSVAAGDQSGYDTDLTLTVNAGDVIRFVVTSDPGYNTAGDTTSWAPSISYTS
jgi:plastocyanin